MTALEWYYQRTVIEGKTNYFKIFEEAKQMEKQQIIDAYTEGNRLEFYDASETIGKQYYNETYGSKGSDSTLNSSLNSTLNSSSQTEISDEQIKKVAYKYKENELEDTWEAGISFMDGAKWYREQLKSKH